MPDSSSHQAPDRLTAGVLWCAGVISLAWFLHTVLSDFQQAGTFVSQSLWEAMIGSLGGAVERLPSGLPIARISFFKLLLISTGFCGVLLLAGSGLLRFSTRKAGARYREAVLVFAADARWWCLLLVWQVLSIVTLLGGWESAMELTWGTIPFWFALSLAAANSRALAGDSRQSFAGARLPRLPSWPAVAGILLFVITFTIMNWQLYANLQTPHGDSAMYEEHLWNLTHGKGFRSYLDQGLFLGEHIQVIHLLLIPLYLLWPSHLLLELSEAIALGLCAIPVYRMTLRHTESRRAATLMALAALVYVPLHFLEISIDLKTFRPISFGVPLLLATIDALECRQYRRACFFWMPLTLLAKEDFAAILAPLGLWIAWRAWREQNDKAGMKAGLGLAVLSVVYLLFVVKFAIPFFREGADPHYSRYFGELGNSPGDIARSLFTQPGAVFGRLFSQRTIVSALALIVPLGGLPLLSPSRLLVGVPLFGVLSLIQLSDQTGSSATDIVFHHFHAPLVPILFWSAAAGSGRLRNFPGWFPSRGTSVAFLSGIATSVFFSISPLGISFWDSHSVSYWKSLYLVDERAGIFENVIDAIPRSARVASTDFVHPRFTHYERSYDYSQYVRKVSDYELRVPDDTDYIVIDTGHRYSWIQTPDDIPELQEHPERWDILPIDTKGYFIVLKRKDIPPESTP